MSFIDKMPEYQIAPEIPFSQLVDGETYRFLWGPYHIFLSGVFVETDNKNNIADFTNSRHENGLLANDDGETATLGPFFSINTRTIYVCKT